MDLHSVEKLQETLAKLGTHEQAVVLDFAEFLVQKQAKPLAPAYLSEEEHARIVAVLPPLSWVV